MHSFSQTLMRIALVSWPMLVGLTACTTTTDGFQELIEIKLADEQNYSIVLADMDISEDGEVFKHKYTIVKDKNGTPVKEDTDFMEVTPEFFADKIEDLGMEIATMDNGTLHMTSSPAGYTRYVGDERYGKWQVGENGEKVWVFNQQYNYIPGFYGMYWPIFFMDFDSYKRKHKYKSSYYGTGAGLTRMYGTNSTWHQTASKNGFKTKVNGFVSRSGSYGNLKQAASSGKLGSSLASGFKNNVNNKVSRSGSGYSGSNSFSRSRSSSGGGK